MHGNEWIYLGALLDGNGLNLLNRLCNCSKHRVKIKKPECSNGMKCSIKNCSSESNSISVSSTGVSVWFSALVLICKLTKIDMNKSFVWSYCCISISSALMWDLFCIWIWVYIYRCARSCRWQSCYKWCCHWSATATFFCAVIAWILFHFLVNVDNMHDIDDALRSFCRHSFWPNRKQCITAEKSVGITNMQIQMSYVYTGFCMHKPHTFFPSLLYLVCIRFRISRC